VKGILKGMGARLGITHKRSKREEGILLHTYVLNIGSSKKDNIA
jgi:hypothetical protein